MILSTHLWGKETYRGGLLTGECRGAKGLCPGSGRTPPVFKFPQDWGIKGVENRLIDSITYIL